MIEIRRKWMNYSYFNRDPRFRWNVTHLFSPVKRVAPGQVCLPFSTMVVDVTDPQFLNRWSGSTRNKINKALKENLAVVRGPYLLPDILRLFSITTKRKRMRGYTLSHFEAFPKLECSAVMYEGIMLCGHVWIIDESEKRAMLYVNATNLSHDQENNSLPGQAHYFMLWQDGLYFRDMGLETMDLMGYETETSDTELSGVYQWKSGTHGQVAMLYHYYPKWFYFLRKVRDQIIL